MTKPQDIELITFDTCVHIVERIFQSNETSLTPLMKATLGCIWEKTSYQKYIDSHQLEFAVGSLKTKANIIYKAVGEYFHISDLRRPNFKDTFQRLYLSGRLDEFSDLISKPREMTIQYSREDSKFVGRDHELSKLLSSLKGSRCVNIWGSIGVGKTSLVREYEARNEATTGKIVWTTPTPDLTDWLSDTATVMGLSASNNSREHLFKELFQKKWTVIIDDTVQVNEIINDFIKPLCKADCKSRFIFISRSRQRIFHTIEEGCCLQLSGLVEYETLFESLGISGKERWEELAKKYNYNPGELLNIAKIIKSFFNGNAAAYLDNCSTVFSQNSLEVASNFEFSKTELRILTIINEKRQMDLRDIFKTLQGKSLSSNDIFDCMATLENHAIIEKTQNGFIVSPVVRKRLLTEGKFD